MITENRRRLDFPALQDIAYLNTAAESIPPICVGQALQQYWIDKQLGMKGRDRHYATMEACREISARMTGFQTGEVAFCSCSSEAYNLLSGALALAADDEVVVTDLDFPAGATPWLRAKVPPTVRLWRAAGGVLQLQDLLSLLNERTRLVQVSLISFYNGFRIDWRPFRDCVRAHAPNALISVDVTQALGRIVPDWEGGDVLISSTHKWTLGIHGGCIVGIPKARSEQLTTNSGGWFHLANAFEADRFDRAVPKPGAASYAVGMPNFPAIYALNAALRYVSDIGVEAIQKHADPLVRETHLGLIQLGLEPMAPLQEGVSTGILAFRHPRSDLIHQALEKEKIHVMHHAGRIRIAVHGYNTEEDVSRFLDVMGRALANGS